MIYILTGMHRSGTSMFARFIHESGINMGGEFYRDETANKYGHYEDIDFLNLQRRELARAFKGEDYLVFKDFVLSNQFVSQAKELFEKRIDHHKGNDWGWKDPRTTVFLTHWQNINLDIRFIFMVRKPESVINSLCKLLKTKWSLAEKSKYLKTYIYYNQQILDFVSDPANKYVAIVSFEDLVMNPKTELEKLHKRIGFEFDPELFVQLFDGKVISGRQQIPWVLLRPQLQKARQVYLALSKYF
ncbi:MAG: sulfotransferase [Bacteroidales bacterium]|nr:sulfotransferase [Bacteroidales bacterium]